MKWTPIAASLLLSLAAYANAAADDVADPFALVRTQFDAGNYPAARAAAEPLLQQDASEAQAHYWLGRIALRTGDLDTAVDELEEAVDAAPDNAEFQLRFGQASCALAGHPDTGMLRKAGLAGDCRDGFEAATKLDPTLLAGWQGLFEFYRQAPGIVGGGVDKAEALLGTIDALDPAEGQVARAGLAVQQERHADASAHLAKAAELKPAKADEYRFQQALALMQGKQFDAAYALLNSAQAGDAVAANVQYQLGRIAVLAERSEWYAGAERALLAYLDRDDLTEAQPNKAWAAFRLGQLYELMGKPALAAARFQWAAGQQPDERLQDELKKKKVRS